MSRIVYVTSLALSLIFLIAPLLFVMPLAFNDSSYLAYPMQGVTLRWFEDVLNSATWIPAFFNSLKVAVGAMAMAVVIGGLAAVGALLTRSGTQLVLSALFVSPIVVPSVVLGVAFAYAFGRTGLSGTYLGLVFAHAILGAPLVFLSVMTSLRGLDPDLDLAAASLGASRRYRFRTITLPLAMPGFLAGALFSFIISFDEVIVALFLVSPGSTTLPVALYAGLRDRLEPSIVVVAFLLSVLSFFFLLALSRIQKRTR